VSKKIFGQNCPLSKTVYYIIKISCYNYLGSLKADPWLSEVKSRRLRWGGEIFYGSQLEYLHFADREECERVIIWRVGRQLMSISHKIHASECCQSHIPVFVILLIFQTGTGLLKFLLPGVQWAYLLMTFITSQAQHMSILCLFSIPNKTEYFLALIIP